MDIGIIIVGDEILSGKREDKHLSKVIELLGARGLQLAYAHYVGDDPERITSTMRTVLSKPDIVFSFGGIGATPDDHTRGCAARALGVELALHPEARDLIMERMADMARQQGAPFNPEAPDFQHRLNMGVFPAGSQIIPNPFNKIPGFSCVSGAGAHLHCVPGFPVMAHPMVQWLLDTKYQHMFRQKERVEKSIIVFGAMEAALTPLMIELEKRFDVKVFSLPSVDHPQFGRHIEIGVKGAVAEVEKAYLAMHQTLVDLEMKLGPELVR